MARLPEVGGDRGNWGDILNDFLLQAHNADGTDKIDPAQMVSVVVVTGAEPRPVGYNVIAWVDMRVEHVTQPVNMEPNDLWMIGQQARQVQTGTQYSVWGTTVPNGSWSLQADGTPYIELAQGFTKYTSQDPINGLTDNARILGARLWLDSSLSQSDIPAQITFRLYAPGQDIGGAPTQVKVADVPILSPGQWYAVYFDMPQNMGNDGDIWMISYQFTDVGSIGKYIQGIYARPNTTADNSISSLYNKNFKWVEEGSPSNHRSLRYQIGIRGALDGDTTSSYGLDIIVDEGV